MDLESFDYLSSRQKRFFSFDNLKEMKTFVESQTKLICPVCRGSEENCPECLIDDLYENMGDFVENESTLINSKDYL